jgi:hypothetical protein
VSAIHNPFSILSFYKIKKDRGVYKKKICALNLSHGTFEKFFSADAVIWAHRIEMA